VTADEATRSTGRRPSAARQRLLDTADRLFYAHGVQAVGVDRLLAEAGVTRVTFYRHFPTKEDLVEAYLRERMARGRRRVTDILERSPDDPRAALDEIARTFVDDSTIPGLRGCEFVNAASEYSADSDPARVLAVEQRRWIRDVTADLLGRLGHAHPHELAEVLLMLRTGAVIAAGLDGSESAFPRFLQTWDALVDSRRAETGQGRAIAVPPDENSDDAPLTGARGPRSTRNRLR
jgi:AcrR family transcriptional regulator